MNSDSFSKFYVIYCRDANSGLRSGKEAEAFWWSRIPNDSRCRSRIFCPTPDVQLDCFEITLLSWEFLLSRYNFLWNFCSNREFLLCDTISTECWLLKNFLSPNFIHFVLRRRGRKFWNGRSWSQTFYLRLRNPGCHTWMMASISLVMVVRSNFCKRDFLIDHKFSMGLRSGEFPVKSITFNFASWKPSSLFQMKDTGQYLIVISFHHQERRFSYLWSRLATRCGWAQPLLVGLPKNHLNPNLRLTPNIKPRVQNLGCMYPLGGWFSYLKGHIWG